MGATRELRAAVQDGDCVDTIRVTDQGPYELERVQVPHLSTDRHATPPASSDWSVSAPARRPGRRAGAAVVVTLTVRSEEAEYSRVPWMASE